MGRTHPAPPQSSLFGAVGEAARVPSEEPGHGDRAGFGASGPTVRPVPSEDAPSSRTPQAVDLRHAKDHRPAYHSACMGRDVLGNGPGNSRRLWVPSPPPGLLLGHVHTDLSDDPPTPGVGPPFSHRKEGLCHRHAPGVPADARQWCLHLGFPDPGWCEGLCLSCFDARRDRAGVRWLRVRCDLPGRGPRSDRNPTGRNDPKAFRRGPPPLGQGALGFLRAP